MSMETLWAPWRMEFIKGCGKEQDGCFLCRAGATPDARADLVVRRGRTAFAMLNRYPYNNGHLLISPLRHEGRMEGLTSEELAEIMALTVEAKRALDRLMAPHGYNVGANLGRAAGAGVESHFHLHLVPRWSGDTNFMTAVGSTKVIPQSLDELRSLLNAEWAAMKGGETPC
jgi:ATP adenylyltransferase